MTKPMPKDVQEKLLRLHQEGLNASQMAAELGYSVKTIQRHRRRLGLTIPPPPTTRITPEWTARVQALLDDGVSIREAALTVGCNRETIGRHFKGQGWSYGEAGRFAMALRQVSRKAK